MRCLFLVPFVSLACIVLSNEQWKPVSHDRAIRRCENDTWTWRYPNDTTLRSPWSASSGAPGNGPTSGDPSSLCLGYGGLPCYPTASGSQFPPATSSPNSLWSESATITAWNSSAPTSSVSPELASSDGIVFSSINITTSTTGENWTSNTISSTASETIVSGENTASLATETETDTDTVSSSVLTLTIPATTTTVPINATVTAVPLPPETSSCLNASGLACTPGNATASGSGLDTSTLSPLWSNTSSLVNTIVFKNRTTAQAITSVVTTLTLDITPSPFTPGPITPVPEEITITATVPIRPNLTFPIDSGQDTTTPRTPSSASGPSQSSSASGFITMTIVVAGNSTSIISPVTASSDGGGDTTSSVTPSNSTSDLARESPPEATRGTPSPPPESASTTDGSNSSTDSPVLQSSSSSVENATATILGNGTTSSVFWTNSSLSTPCPLESSHSIWSDWNITITRSTRSGQHGNSTATPTAGPTNTTTSTSSATATESGSADITEAPGTSTTESESSTTSISSAPEPNDSIIPFSVPSASAPSSQTSDTTLSLTDSSPAETESSTPESLPQGIPPQTATGVDSGGGVTLSGGALSTFVTSFGSPLTTGSQDEGNGDGNGPGNQSEDGTDDRSTTSWHQPVVPPPPRRRS